MLPPFSSSPHLPVGTAGRAVTHEGGGMSHISKHTFSNVLSWELGQPALHLTHHPFPQLVLKPYLKSGGAESGSGGLG